VLHRGHDVLESFLLLLIQCPDVPVVHRRQVELCGGDLVLQLVSDELQRIEIALIPLLELLRCLTELVVAGAEILVALLERLGHRVEDHLQALDLILLRMRRFGHPSFEITVLEFNSRPRQGVDPPRQAQSQVIGREKRYH